MVTGPSIPPGRGSRRWLPAAIAAALAVAACVAWAASRPGRTPEGVRARLRADLLGGPIERSEEALDWLARHDRLTTPDLMAKARVAQLRGRPDEAVATLATIGGRDAVAARAALMIGLIHLGRDRARLAEASFREALEIDPGLTDARYELIRIYGRQQRLAALDEQYHALANRDALDFERLNFWVLARNTPWNAAEDIDLLVKWVEADPEDRASRLALAEGNRRLGRTDRAREVLAPLPDSDLDARALRAQLAMDGGDTDGAARLLDLPSAPHAGLARLRGQLALARRDPRAAVRELALAYRLDPGDRPTLVALGSALTSVGASDTARPFFDAMTRFRALDALVLRLATPEAIDADILERIGSACEAVGRRTEARAWYTLAIARNPLQARAQQGLFRLGRATTDAPPVGPDVLEQLRAPRPARRGGPRGRENSSSVKTRPTARPQRRLPRRPPRRRVCLGLPVGRRGADPVHPLDPRDGLGPTPPESRLPDRCVNYSPGFDTSF